MNTPSGQRGAALMPTLIVAAGLAIVAGVWLSVVHAGTPGEGDAAPPPRSTSVSLAEALGADPMTMAGQRRLQAARIGRQHTPSRLIIPDQTIPLRFSHKLHLEQGMDCMDCHASVTGSIRSQDVNLPQEADCLICHDVTAPDEWPPSSCSTCHPGYEPEWLPDADRSDTSQVKVHPPAIHFPPPNLKFNHKIHIDKGIGCATCHGDMTEVDLATRENSLPVMGTCISCHDGQEVPNACSTCHLTQPDGRLQTLIAGEHLVPAGWYHNDAHDDDWLYTHRLAAGLGDGYCETCHTQQECVDCHSGVQKPLRVHPNNWILQHASAARRNTPDCQSCHRTQTYCVDCHQATQVVWEEPNRPVEAIRFHPEGWVSAQGTRGQNHHAFEAQRNIRACASCHTEDSCMTCHSTLGLGINPHPPGFIASGACDRMRDKNDRVCTKCHMPGARAFSCMR